MVVNQFVGTNQTRNEMTHTMISLPVDPRVISGEYSERGKSWIITDGETRGLIGVPGCNVD